jgi:hypothetical protein
MSVKVHLYSNLPLYAGNQTVVAVDGTTIGQCLMDLVRRYPDLGPQLFDKGGNILQGMFVSLNLKSPKSENIASALHENDEIYLIKIVAGG